MITFYCRRVIIMKYEIKQFPCVREDNGKNVFLTRCASNVSDPDKNILITHGLTVTQHIFDVNYQDYSFTRWFAGKGYTVWRMDVGGYGRSDSYENGFEVTTENAAKDIIRAMEVIKETQGEAAKINLLGWSWGTMTTSTAAHMRPDLVNKLGLMAPCTGGVMPVIEVPVDKGPFEYPVADRLFQHEKSGFVELRSAQGDPSMSNEEIDYDITDPCVCAIVLQYVFKYDCMERPNGGAKHIYEAGEDYLLDGTKISCPTIVLRGSLDIYSKLERCYELMEQLPEGSEFHAFRGAGHTLYLEKDYYRPFREAIYNFLEK